MSFDLQSLVLASTAYLLFLFLCAWLTETGRIPRRMVQHPAVYVLSLGIYASSWAYYGSIGIAHDTGYLFLTFYFGLSGAFLLAPIVLSPLLKIIHNHQLGSLADLFAFRFRSPVAGILTTLLLLGITMPLLTLQIQAISDSVHLLSQQSSPETLAIGFCLLVILFALLFGSHPIGSQDHHQGLVFAVAMASLLKLLVLLSLGGVILFQVFGGSAGLESWLAANSHRIMDMSQAMEVGPWRTTLLMFFASAIVMPHMFHMTFTENRDRRTLYVASWGLPLFLLLVSISAPLVLWGGLALSVDIPPEYFPLAIGQVLDLPLLTLAVYLGGLSAATGLIVVNALALSSMLLNHVILPWYYPAESSRQSGSIYRQLVWLKRVLIVALIMASYGFYRLLDSGQDLYSLSIVAYVGALQLLPGALCTLYWRQANRRGFIAGLLAGAAVWFVTLMLPLILGHLPLAGDSLPILASAFIANNGYLAASSALLVNVLVFFLVSSMTTMDDEEQQVAESCLAYGVALNRARIPKGVSAREFQEVLCTPLGLQAAQAEVGKALAELGMTFEEQRPHALARLREKIESNLSGLMGPTVAHDIISTFLPLDSREGHISQNLHFLETRLESYQSRLTGLAARFDSLRRYHRETLNSIPLGVCAIGQGDILLWNQAMTAMTGIDGASVLGKPLDQLPQPWRTLLTEFLAGDRPCLKKHCLVFDRVSRCFNLHRATIEASVAGIAGSQVMVLEDMTEQQQLEEQLAHRDRLASIGQLAAGVAHEIGNPITGIDCLAQELRTLSVDPDVYQSAEQILEQTQRVSRIVQMLVSYAHQGHYYQENDPENDQKNHQKQPVTVYACVNEAIGLLKLNKKHASMVFANECAGHHRVCGNSQKLQQVFINLLTNAADASAGQGAVTIRSQADGADICIRIEDNGHGIPRAIQEKLFDPFFTTKEVGKGTGLGLALVWNIIEEHGGSIQVVSPCHQPSQRGTCFIMTLPGYGVSEVDRQDGIQFQGELP